MLEFVIAFPVVLVLILACIQFAHLLIAKQVVHYAAYCAARAALVSVCDQQDGPSIENDSWPSWDQLVHSGLDSANTMKSSIADGRNSKARSEAEWYANKAAAQVCAWVVLGESAADAGNQKEVPGWGKIPGSGAADRKTRAIVDVIDWNVRATVEFDFPLITPIVGPLLAWGANPWDPTHPWAIQNTDATGDAHALDSVVYPHIRLTETIVLPKPYRTVIAAENWAQKINVSIPILDVGDIRHHIGDGQYGEGQGGGNMINEGLSFNLPFTLSQAQLDHALIHNNGVIYLSFSVTGINAGYNNQILFNGQVISGINNGNNQIAIPVGGLQEGTQTVTFVSGYRPWGGYDDFEVDNIRVTY